MLSLFPDSATIAWLEHNGWWVALVTIFVMIVIRKALRDGTNSDGYGYSDGGPADCADDQGSCDAG